MESAMQSTSTITPPLLWGNPLGWPDLSRISTGNEGKAVDGGRGDENHEHTHTNHDNRSNIIPRIGVGRSSLSTTNNGDEMLGEILTTWGRETENPRPCTT